MSELVVMRARPLRLTLGTVAATAGAVAVLVVSLSRPHWLLVNDEAVRAGLETGTGLAALAGSVVALLRAERTRMSGDLALALGFALISLTSMLLAIGTVAGGVGSASSMSWLPVPGRLLGAALLVQAGKRGRALPSRVPGLVGLVRLLVPLAVLLAVAGAALGPLLGGASLRLSLQLVTIGLSLLGGVTLARRAERAGDSVLPWFAAAAIALAYARATFMLFPAPGDTWVSPGDLVRLGVAAMLAMAIRAEFVEHRSRSQQTAIAEERRRLAREIHDGLAQELAFIVSQSRRLIAREPQAEGLELLAAAGQTALADARRTIFKMNQTNLKTLSAAIVERTFRIADRAGLALDVEVEGELTVDPEVEHEILRIVGEAVSNAARHAKATRVSISIAFENAHVVVRITDDGDGFDPGAARKRRGFGLTSMTQRAESLGGQLRLESQPGSGTVIEVAI